MNIGIAADRTISHNVPSTKLNSGKTEKQSVFSLLLNGSTKNQSLDKEKSVVTNSDSILNTIQKLIDELQINSQPIELSEITKESGFNLIDNLPKETKEEIVDLLEASSTYGDLLKQLDDENSKFIVLAFVIAFGTSEQMNKNNKAGDKLSPPQMIGQPLHTQLFTKLTTEGNQSNLQINKLLKSVSLIIEQSRVSGNLDFSTLVNTEKQSTLNSKTIVFPQKQLQEMKLNVENTRPAGETNLGNTQFSLSQLEQYKVHVTPERIAENRLVQEFQSIIQSGKFQVSKNGGVQLQIKLFPEHLGKLDITLIEKNGEMVAKIIATTQASKELIESQLHQLKQAFNTQNINVEKIEIQQRFDTTFQQEQHETDDGKQQQGQEKQQENQFTDNDEPEQEQQSFASFLSGMNEVV
jgi:flagellar hook-length control protein FliK